MRFHAMLAGLGAVLLLFPAAGWLSSEVQLRGFDYFRNLQNSPRDRPWWRMPVLWLDPLRGFAGARLLVRGLELERAGWWLVPKPAFTGFAVILAVGVLAQIFTRSREEGVMLAPIGFVAGIVVALVPWPLAAAGLVAGVVGMCAFREFQAFFIGALLALVPMGFVFETKGWWLAAAAGALVIPMLAAVLTGCALELPFRKKV